MGNRLLKLRSTALAAAVVSTTLALSFTVAKADSFLDEVTANVAKLANPQTEWQGPTSSPKPDANKFHRLHVAG